MYGKTRPKLNTFQYMFFLPDYISSIKDRMKFKIVVRLLNYALTSERISKIYMPRPNFIPENITPDDIPHLLNTSGKSIKEICLLEKGLDGDIELRKETHHRNKEFEL